MPHHGDGPIPARIMLVGEYWGEDEEREGLPFVGTTGMELNRMLHEVGIMRSECFLTNVINHQPPGKSQGRPVNNDITAWIPMRKKDVTAAHIPLKNLKVMPVVVEGYLALRKEIDLVKPNLIIAMGNVAMWALTGKWGIMNWRGSQLMTDAMEGPQVKVIPTHNPAAVLREWPLRAAVLEDLRRAKRNSYTATYTPPARKYIIRPNLNQVMDCLKALHARLESGEEVWMDFDIETRSGHIECFSLSWSRLDAICIPIMSYTGTEGYWSTEEETNIIYASYRVLTHPRAKIRWQNGLYDAQYTHRWWLFIPRGCQDTMISQHTIFSDQPKALHYQASVYADWYVYWKEEGKLWNPKMAPEQRWAYNCDDCVYTREIGEVEAQVVEKMGLKEVHDFQQKLFWPVLKAMNRGVRIIEGNATDLAVEIQEQISIRESFLFQVVGHPININSSQQLQAFFYTDLQQRVIMSKAKKGSPAHPTCDDEALKTIGVREPLLLPIVNCIADIRTLEKFLGDFVLMKRDTDGRMRCSFNIGGSEKGKSAPKTYRLSSSKSAFGSGGNMQTIPSEKSKSIGKWDARAKQHFDMIGDPYKLPNLRSMFGPDPGMTFFDMDLDRADLQVFVWEIADDEFKKVLRQGVDVHLFHAYLLANKEPPPLDELVEAHPKYPDHKGAYKHGREFAKVFCHATDYYGKARTVAAATGRTIHETERAQRRYLSIHPTIEPYWKDQFALVQKRRYVENKFGYRWYIFDRIDESLMGEIIAWIPQSTVSVLINKIWVNIDDNLPEVEVLLQVHDSLAGQFPTNRKDYCIGAMMEQSKVIVPYDDPLIIPTGMGTSEISWGAC